MMLVARIVSPVRRLLPNLSQRSFYTTGVSLAGKNPTFGNPKPKIIKESDWEEIERLGKPENDKVTIYASRRQVKGSPWKLNLVAKQIRRLPVDEAIRQMQFSPKGAAKTVLEVLKDAKQRGCSKADGLEHLYIDESYAGKGTYKKMIKYHGRGRRGIMHKHYSHYFLKLREGTPPPPKTKRTMQNHKSTKTKDLWLRKTPLSIPNCL
ncbi:large ribosomal subunit protein uL22m-like [Oscarella lobularis]|uniref:large ribosomal subunit protein uL22m-like n=1 Tax=Oscarella lobularis TaxID=121494 RepID=UPI003313E4BC